MRLRRPWWRRNQPPSCKHVGRVLQAYLDGQLDPADVEAVAEHLEACVHCGLELATYERIKASLAAPSSDPPDPETLARLRQFTEELTER